MADRVAMEQSNRPLYEPLMGALCRALRPAGAQSTDVAEACLELLGLHNVY